MKNTTQTTQEELAMRTQKINEKMKKIRMTNTTATIEELAMRTMIAELKIMNLKLDLLEQEIDDRENEMDGLNKGINKLENKIDEKLAK